MCVRFYFLYTENTCNPSNVSRNFAGRRNPLLLSVRNLDYKCESQASGLYMEPVKESVELNRNLYANIEPYETGFLKVSDLHSIYYEQSGSPSGHVRGRGL